MASSRPQPGASGSSAPGASEHQDRQVELQVAHQVAGEHRLGRERPAVARDHPQPGLALAEGHPAPVHLEVDEVEVPEQEAGEEREGEPRASSSPERCGEGRQPSSPATSRRTMTKKSMRKAVSRSPAGATTKGSDIPSGVEHPVDPGALSAERRSSAPAPRQGSTRSRRPAVDGGKAPADGDVVHELAEDPLDQARDQEHGDGADGEQRRPRGPGGRGCAAACGGRGRPAPSRSPCRPRRTGRWRSAR